MDRMLILGGDLRLLKVADEFIKDGFKVSVYGIDSKYFECPYNTYNNIITALDENDVIIMGLPVTRDGITLNTPLWDHKIYLNDITSSLKEDKIVFGGMISEELSKNLSGVTFFDYFNREELIVRNAIPTVEGAISIAIEETPFTLHGSECLVCGFGRIGKFLAKTLSVLGASVTVSARKKEDLAWINCFGYRGIATNSIYNEIERYDIIFNTIPYNILNKDCLDKVRKDSIIIDLASKPGGLDFGYANSIGLKTVWALSLPGKTAPHTAGIIIKDTISNILNELEE